jgi:hypothetical protein
MFGNKWVVASGVALHVISMTEYQYQETIRKVGRNGNGNGRAPAHAAVNDEAAFGYPRDFLENQFVYLAISPRAGGLSVGVNVNATVKCSFNCLYCEIDRARPARAARFDAERMAAELDETLRLAYSGHLRQLPRYAKLPDALLQPRHVALSGDGEPTLSNHFATALFEINHLRVRGQIPFFKIVVVTNSTGLDRPGFHEGAELNELVAGLNKLSRNLLVVLGPGGAGLVPRAFAARLAKPFHNAVAVLREVSEYELRVHLQEPGFAARVRRCCADFEAYLNEQEHLVPPERAGAAQKSGRLFLRRVRFSRIAAHFGGRPRHSRGRPCKSASDLGLGFVGISLFYREGYFQQAIDSNNWQTEYYNPC